MKRILVQFFLLVFVLPVYSEEMGVGDKSVDKISAEYKVEIRVKKDNSLVVFVHGDGWKSIKAKNKKVIDDESFIKLLVLGERMESVQLQHP